MNKYCAKHFIFKNPIFVELLHVYGRLHEFSQLFIKCLSAPIKIPKTYWFQKEIEEIEAGTCL